MTNKPQSGMTAILRDLYRRTMEDVRYMNRAMDKASVPTIKRADTREPVCYVALTTRR